MCRAVGFQEMIVKKYSVWWDAQNCVTEDIIIIIILTYSK